MATTPGALNGRDPAVTEPNIPGDLRMIWLIARRAAVEALRDRGTLLLSLFFAVGFPIMMVLLAVRPLAHRATATGQASVLGTVMAIHMLMVGLLPASSAVGIASGQFAGEKEQGNLTPLLASPASNLAIFAGKVLGAIVPALLFMLLAEFTYLTTIAVLTGPATLRRLPPDLALAMFALAPAVALFAAVIASLISSRVRTFNTAQQIGGLALLPIWVGLSILSGKMQTWGSWSLFATIAVLLAVDVALTVLAAATWRREEVLAQR